MLLSIVIPCYRSAHTISKVVEMSMEVIDKIEGLDCEFVLVNDCSPDNTYEAIQALAEKYPNARIVDIEKEKNGMTEVEIVHGSISKDVMFTAEGAWAYTIWDISKRHLEDVVKNAVTAAHPGYVIDDADFIETPDGSYFLVEMEQGEREIYVKVTAEGEILP